jgi:hypothetical protein
VGKQHCLHLVPNLNGVFGGMIENRRCGELGVFAKKAGWFP